MKNGRAVGVVLDNGREYQARRVISNMDVRRTFLKHVDEKELPGEFLKRVRAFKTRGSSGKLNIALDSLPEFTAPAERGAQHQG